MTDADIESQVSDGRAADDGDDIRRRAPKRQREDSGEAPGGEFFEYERDFCVDAFVVMLPPSGRPGGR